VKSSRSPAPTAELQYKDAAEDAACDGGDDEEVRLIAMGPLFTYQSSMRQF
jgi:hypothetical protein